MALGIRRTWRLLVVRVGVVAEVDEAVVLLSFSCCRRLQSCTLLPREACHL